jgi:hypothetical protein
MTGITLCRKAPATVNDGEIAAASNEELHAAPLSGKHLLALWLHVAGSALRTERSESRQLVAIIRSRNYGTVPGSVCREATEFLPSGCFSL